MAKVGNYVQRDYHKTFSTKRQSTWSDYNKAWNGRRQASSQKMQQLRNLASTFGDHQYAGSSDEHAVCHAEPRPAGWLCEPDRGDGPHQRARLDFPG